jgi:uncharacterized UPF0160 family protein
VPIVSDEVSDRLNPILDFNEMYSWKDGIFFLGADSVDHEVLMMLRINKKGVLM